MPRVKKGARITVRLPENLRAEFLRFSVAYGVDEGAALRMLAVEGLMARGLRPPLHVDLAVLLSSGITPPWLLMPGLPSIADKKGGVQ